jgi:hypothetical protein
MVVTGDLAIDWNLMPFAEFLYAFVNGLPRAESTNGIFNPNTDKKTHCRMASPSGNVFFYPKLVTIQAIGAKQSLILRVSSAFSKPEGTERLEWPEPGQW